MDQPNVLAWAQERRKPMKDPRTPGYEDTGRAKEKYSVLQQFVRNGPAEVVGVTNGTSWAGEILRHDVKHSQEQLQNHFCDQREKDDIAHQERITDPDQCSILLHHAGR